MLCEGNKYFVFPFTRFIHSQIITKFCFLLLMYYLQLSFMLLNLPFFKLSLFFTSTFYSHMTFSVWWLHFMNIERQVYKKDLRYLEIWKHLETIWKHQHWYI